ncbi:MAG TPA: penicillin-binding protein 2 [Candidatus Saccharimonadales bacterium]|nr:penicillin-binding protein 2 [Candidatus Saccharimonadales bacterium]
MGSLDEPVTRRSALRFLAFGALAAGGIGIEAVRLAYMQLVQPNGSSSDLTPANTTATIPVPSIRGLIYDRSGRLLVTNEPTWAVKILPADLPFSERPQVVARLSSVLGLSAAKINETIDAAPGSTFDLVTITAGVPDSVARLLAETQASLPGVHVTVESERRYVDGPLFSHVIGYTGAIDGTEFASLAPAGYLVDDRIGKAGIEASHESELRGTYGTETVQRDATGLPIATLGSTSPLDGHSLRLTIDTREQRFAQQALQWGVDTAHLVAGIIIAMNPQTGEVLAIVSLPTYDNNEFVSGVTPTEYARLLSQPGRPLVDHAISDQYPPGSTYKVVTGTGALADGKITPTTLIDTKAYLTIGAYRYPDWNNAGWGPIDIYLGFGNSSDTFFYQVAAMLGIDRLAYWAHQFGFGDLTKIDLPAEVAGTVPTNKWKFDTLGQFIFPGEVYHAGIGQGYDEVTAIQLINAYCALANGGRLYQPQIVRDVYTADGNIVRPFEPKLLHQMDVPADVLRTMRNAARTAVVIRHTYNLVDMPIKVAGKTGTAEFGIRDKLGRLPYHDWGVFFLPKDPYNGNFDGTDSELVVLAFANDSRTIGNTSTEIVKYFLQLHYDIKKDYRLPQLLQQGNFYGD